MFKIGITGSIGTGKSSTANMFACFKIPIFDADEEIKKLLSARRIKRELRNTWPDIIKNEHINKHKLKKIIFSDKKERKKLECLLYPYLQIEKEKFEGVNHRKHILAYDVPLIYETETEKYYDLIILTYCDPELQEKRVLNRDKISNLLYKKIIKSQLSFEEKTKFNPIIINTGNPKPVIFIKVLLLLMKILIRLKIERWKKIEN